MTDITAQTTGGAPTAWIKDEKPAVTRVAQGSGSRLPLRAPYNRSDGDVVLRSHDNVGFKVHRLYMAMASPIFAAMFSLPQPPASDSDQPKSTQSELSQPIVEMEEGSQVIQALLDICYPFKVPDLSSLNSINATLQAAVKYEITKAIEQCRRELRNFLPQEPLRVFAIACRMNFRMEASLAASSVLSLSIFLNGPVYVEELKQVSAGCYHRLVKNYRNQCIPVFFNFCTDANVEATGSDQHITLIKAPPPFDSPDTDAVITTSDGVSFYVNAEFISSVAPGLAARLLPIAGARVQHNVLDSDTGDDVSEKRVCQKISITVKENSKHLSMLLVLCHPMCSLDIFTEELSTIARLIISAKNYGMDKVVWLLRLVLPKYIARDPFRTYVVASTWGWSGEAREAADVLLGETINDIEARYVEEMEIMPARAYYQLLAYHARCRAAISSADSATNTWVTPDAVKATVYCSSCSHYGYETRESKWLRGLVSRAKALLAARPSPGTVSTGVGLIELTREVYDESCSSCRRSACQQRIISVTESIADKVKNMNAQVGHRRFKCHIHVCGLVTDLAVHNVTGKP